MTGHYNFYYVCMYVLTRERTVPTRISLARINLIIMATTMTTLGE